MPLSPPAERAFAPDLVPVSHVVTAKHQETHDTWTLELEPTGDALPAFAPGQFAMLYAFGVGEAPISISGGADVAGSLIHTIRAVGSVTRMLCAVEVGEYVGVRGPFGSAWSFAAAEGRDVLVVAGGIGLAPLRPLVDQVLSRRDCYGRVTLLYGGRAPGELLYPEDLERWRARFDVQVEVTVDSAADGWRGRVGVVPALIPRAEPDPHNTTAFVCGPEVMMRFTVAALQDAGVPTGSILLSLERSMRCAVGHCGHCQLRELFICKDGPVFSSDRVLALMAVREL